MLCKVKPISRFQNVKVLHFDDTENEVVVPLSVITDGSGVPLGTSDQKINDPSNRDTYRDIWPRDPFASLRFFSNQACRPTKK